jgi:hypothetical protein
MAVVAAAWPWAAPVIAAIAHTAVVIRSLLLAADSLAMRRVAAALPHLLAALHELQSTALAPAHAADATPAVHHLQDAIDAISRLPPLPPPRVQLPPQLTQVRYLIDTHGCCVTQQCGARTHHLSH